jgi:hypothetical protein
MLGEIPKHNLVSNIDDHEIPVRLMSSVYQSHVMQQMGLPPIVSFPMR